MMIHLDLTQLQLHTQTEKVLSLYLRRLPSRPPQLAQLVAREAIRLSSEAMAIPRLTEYPTHL